MPMIERSVGDWFLCERCGHLALLRNRTFQCTCARCVQIEQPPKIRQWAKL